MATTTAQSTGTAMTTPELPLPEMTPLTEPWWTWVAICAVYLAELPVAVIRYARGKRQRAAPVARYQVHFPKRFMPCVMR